MAATVPFGNGLAEGGGFSGTMCRPLSLPLPHSVFDTAVTIRFCLQILCEKPGERN